MRRLMKSPLSLPVLILMGLLLSIEVSAATPPIRTANSRQATPPPAPVPDPPAPSTDLTPVPLQSDPSPNPTAAPANPSPTPVPNGGAMYNGPMGTMRQPEPPKKEYLGDPNGLGSNAPRSLTPVPVDSTHAMPLPSAMPGGTDRFGVAPPPGTLGQTYTRRSQIIDEKKHPRVGIVEVHLSENYDVSAKGLKSKWTGKVWQLESDPLLPGIPHIFEVKAEWGPEGNKQKEIRTVRLVMGRIVDLDF